MADEETAISVAARKLLSERQALGRHPRKHAVSVAVHEGLLLSVTYVALEERQDILENCFLLFLLRTADCLKVFNHDF